MKKVAWVVGLLLIVGLSIGAADAFAERTKGAKPAPTNFDRGPDAVAAVRAGTPVRATWDLQWQFFANAAAQPGIETDGTNIYTATWNENIAPNYFSRYQMDGTWVADFAIAGAANIRDMAYDGTYFYGSNATMSLRQMDLANETLISTITATCAGVTGIRHIAYDPTLDGGAGGFWIGNWAELGAIAMDGSQIYANFVGADGCYGSAFDPYSDPANPRLLLFQQQGSMVEIHGFDINTQTYQGVVHDAADVPGFDPVNDLSGGLCIHEDLGSGLALLIGNIQHDTNLIFAYELAVLADPLAPGQPQNLAVVPDAMGVLQAQVDWDNPSTDVAGDPLAELLTVVLELDGVVVYTNPTPTIGAADSQLVLVAAPGSYTFTVKGTNTAGDGLPASQTVWVGEDVPAAPQNAMVTLVDPIASVTWDAPVVGLNGGYFSGTGLTYDVLRNGTVLVADDISSTNLNDTLVAPGNYFYTVIASNASGEGGSATTNAVTYGFLFFEDFAAAGLPVGWAQDGAGGTNWSVVTTNMAGGAANELRFYWSPTFTDVSTMLTPAFSTDGMATLVLEIKHLVDYYAAGIFVRVVTTSDGGTTYNEVWSASPTANIGPETLTIPINNGDVGSMNFQVGFVFDGYSLNIDYWYIDDVGVVGVPVPVELMSLSVE